MKKIPLTEYNSQATQLVQQPTLAGHTVQSISSTNINRTGGQGVSASFFKQSLLERTPMTKDVALLQVITFFYKYKNDQSLRCIPALVVDRKTLFSAIEISFEHIKEIDFFIQATQWVDASFLDATKKELAELERVIEQLMKAGEPFKNPESLYKIAKLFIDYGNRIEAILKEVDDRRISKKSPRNKISS